MNYCGKPEYRMNGVVSPMKGGHERDVGHLFFLLHLAVDRALDAVFQSGQGDSPSEDENFEMRQARKDVEQYAKEIFLGLTGKHVTAFGENTGTATGESFIWHFINPALSPFHLCGAAKSEGGGTVFRDHVTCHDCLEKLYPDAGPATLAMIASGNHESRNKSPLVSDKPPVVSDPDAPRRCGGTLTITGDPVLKSRCVLEHGHRGEHKWEGVI